MVKHAEGIDHTALFPAVHPFAFFGQEAADAHLSLGVVDVDGVVADIEVAADDKVRSLLAELFHPVEEHLEEVHLKLLANIAGGAAGDIDAYECDIAEVGTQDASLAVVTRTIYAGHYAVGATF